MKIKNPRLVFALLICLSILTFPHQIMAESPAMLNSPVVKESGDQNGGRGQFKPGKQRCPPHRHYHKRPIRPDRSYQELRREIGRLREEIRELRAEMRELLREKRHRIKMLRKGTVSHEG